MKQPKARVLVVDNDLRAAANLADVLLRAGYETRYAKGMGDKLALEALRMASSFRPHVAIVDLRISGAANLDALRDGDKSGLALVGEWRNIACILRSAFLTPQLAREALKDHGVFDIVETHQSGAALLLAVNKAAARMAACQGSFTAVWPSAWSPEDVARAVVGEEHKAPAEMATDLLLRLFPDDVSVTLEDIRGVIESATPAVRGRSCVFKVWPARKKEPLVVKFGPANRLAQEAERYRSYVSGNLRGMHHAVIVGQVVIFWDIGAVLYSFVGASRRGLPTFAAFYAEERNWKRIVRPLRHFFSEVWADLYRDTSEISGPLFDAYDKVMDLRRRLERFGNRDARIQFLGIDEPLINPVHWVLRHINDSATPGARQAVTHGDLHGDNLFVDGKSSWAIDFERSGPGPILRDFTELEVDIILRLASGGAELREMRGFIAALLTPRDPRVVPKSDGMLTGGVGTLKGLQVIAGLRKLAHEVARFEDMREYYWGLLVDALFVASISSEASAAQQRALLLGSMIASRLTAWGGEWREVSVQPG